MDITNAATTAAVPLPLHSLVNNAVKNVATAPNHAGKNTHIIQGHLYADRVGVLHRNTAVICIPG